MKLWLTVDTHDQCMDTTSRSLHLEIELMGLKMLVAWSEDLLDTQSAKPCKMAYAQPSR